MTGLLPELWPPLQANEYRWALSADAARVAARGGLQQGGPPTHSGPQDGGDVHHRTVLSASTAGSAADTATSKAPATAGVRSSRWGGAPTIQPRRRDPGARTAGRHRPEPAAGPPAEGRRADQRCRRARRLAHAGVTAGRDRAGGRSSTAGRARVPQRDHDAEGGEDRRERPLSARCSRRARPTVMSHAAPLPRCCASGRRPAPGSGCAGGEGTWATRIRSVRERIDSAWKILRRW